MEENTGNQQQEPPKWLNDFFITNKEGVVVDPSSLKEAVKEGVAEGMQDSGDAESEAEKVVDSILANLSNLDKLMGVISNEMKTENKLREANILSLEGFRASSDKMAMEMGQLESIREGLEMRFASGEFKDKTHLKAFVDVVEALTDNREDIEKFMKDTVANSPLIRGLSSSLKDFNKSMDLMSENLEYREEVAARLDKMKWNELMEEIKLNKEDGKILMQQEKVLESQRKWFEANKESMTQDEQLKVMKDLVASQKKLDTAKGEQKSRGEKLEEKRKEGRFPALTKAIQKSIDGLKEFLTGNAGIIRTIIGTIAILGFMIKRGLISSETIKKILIFLIDAFVFGVKLIIEGFIAGIKVVLEILPDVLSHVGEAIAGLARDLFGEMGMTIISFFGRLISFLAPIGLILNYLKFLDARAVKLGGQATRLSAGMLRFTNFLNSFFVGLQKASIFLLKALGFIPFLGGFFRVAANLFAKIPGIGWVLQAIISTIDFVTGFVRGFSGPDGSLARAFSFGFSEMVDSITFGLISFDAVNRVLQPIFEAITGFFEALFNPIIETFSNIIDIATDDGKSITQKILGILGEIIMHPFRMLMSLFNWLIDTALSIFNMIVEVIVGHLEFIESAIDGLISFFENLPGYVDSMIEGISSFLEELPNMLVDLVISGIDGIISFFEGLFDGSDGVESKKSQLLSNIMSSLMKIPVLIGKIVFVAIPKLAYALVTGIAKILYKLVTSIPMLIGSLLEGIGKAAFKLASKLPEFFTRIYAVFENAFDSVIGFFGGIGDYAVHLYEGAKESIAGFGRGVVDFASGIYGGIAEKLSGMAEYLSPIADVVLSPFNMIYEVFSHISGLVSNALDGLIYFITNPIEAISSFFTGMVDTVRGMIGGVISQADGIGMFGYSLGDFIPDYLRQFASGGGGGGGGGGGATFTPPPTSNITPEAYTELIQTAIADDRVYSAIGAKAYYAQQDTYNIMDAATRVAAPGVTDIDERGVLVEEWLKTQPDLKERLDRNAAIQETLNTVMVERVKLDEAREESEKQAPVNVVQSNNQNVTNTTNEAPVSVRSTPVSDQFYASRMRFGHRLA